MISRPDEILDEAYLNTYRESVSSAFEFAGTEGPDSFQDWDGGLWYMAPTDDQYFEDLEQT